MLWEIGISKIKCQSFQNISKHQSIQKSENIFLNPDKQLGNFDRNWRICNRLALNVLDSLPQPYLGKGTNFEAFYVEQYLINEAVKKANGTIIFTDHGNSFFPEFYIDSTIHDDTVFPTRYMFKKREGMTFLSCYRVPQINFLLYFAPFSTPVWITLILSIILGGLVLGLITKYKGLPIHLLSSALILVGLVIDEATQISEKVKSTLFFKAVICPWLLFGGILSSLYIAVLIENLNSPLDGVRPKKFNDTFCLSLPKDSPSMENTKARTLYKAILYTTVEKFRRKQQNLGIFKEVNCFGYLSKPKVLEANYHQRYKNNETTFFAYYTFQNFLEEMALAISDLNFFNFMNPRSRWFPKFHWNNQNENTFSLENIKELLEREIVSCGKYLYIDSPTEIAAYINYLRVNYPLIKFYSGKEEMFALHVWSFKCYHTKSKVPYYLKLFVSSGIYKILETQVMLHRYGVGRRTTLKVIKFKELSALKFSTVRIDGNIQTIFIIGISSFPGAIAMFFGELCYANKKEIWENIKICWGRVKSFFWKSVYEAYCFSCYLVLYFL